MSTMKLSLVSGAGDLDFSIAPYLRGQSRDALALTRPGGWWSAALLIEGRGHLPLAALVRDAPS